MKLVYFYLVVRVRLGRGRSPELLPVQNVIRPLVFVLVLLQLVSIDTLVPLCRVLPVGCDLAMGEILIEEEKYTFPLTLSRN